MAAIHKLMQADIDNAAPKLDKHGKPKSASFGDGGNLYLQVGPTGTKSWIFRFKMPGAKKEQEMGLGSLATVKVEQARRKAAEYRAMIKDDKNPIDEKRKAEAAARVKSETAMPFSKVLPNELSRRNPLGGLEGKDARHIVSVLQRHGKSIYDMNCADITTAHIMDMIAPLWTEHNPTAVLLLRWTAAVLQRWAKLNSIKGYDNPARWTGHIESLVDVHKHTTKHRASLDYKLMPEFMTRLRALDSVYARAFEFLILTGTRDKETREAVWGEIDLEGARWTIAAERLNKTKTIHEVPLSSEAVALLKSLPSYRDSDGQPAADALLFPSTSIFHSYRGERPFAREKFVAVLTELGYTSAQVVPHGMRSSLADWLAENYSATVPVEVQDTCLNHDKRPEVRGAYVRTRFYDQRIGLMQDWADFLDSYVANVTELDSRRKSSKVA